MTDENLTDDEIPFGPAPCETAGLSIDKAVELLAEPSWVGVIELPLSHEAAVLLASLTGDKRGRSIALANSKGSADELLRSGCIRIERGEPVLNERRILDMADQMLDEISDWCDRGEFEGLDLTAA
jgi:hypothetical protein